MLDKKKFQEIIMNFYDISNKDRLKRLCRTIYAKTYYLTITQLEYILDECVAELSYQYISPKEIGKMVQRIYPYEKSKIAKQKQKLNKIEKIKSSDNSCLKCLNSGYINATYRRKDINGHYSNTFACDCEIGKSLNVDCKTWESKYLDEYEPEYERLSKLPYIKDIRELLPDGNKKLTSNTKEITLQSEILKTITN